MKKAQKTKNSVSWDKVFIFSGEPWHVRQGLNSIVEQMEHPEIIRMNDTTSGKTIFEYLTKFQFDPEMIVLTNPNADQLKGALEALPNMSSSGLAILTPNSTLDGRNALASQANKNDRIWHFNYFEATDAISLKSHIKDWSEYSGKTFNPEALSWVLANAPTLPIKAKTAGTKKDIEAFDLETLESEFDKLLVVSEENVITLELVSLFCTFQQNLDIWAFIKDVVQNNKKEILKKLESINLTQSDQNVLWLLLSQLNLVIAIKECLNKKIFSPETILNHIDANNLIGKYFLEDWTLSEQKPAAVNVWRIIKAIESIENISIDDLILKYQAVNSAIRDLIIGTPSDIVIPYLSLALTNNAKYLKSLDSRF